MPSRLRLKSIVGAIVALAACLPAADATADRNFPAADVARDQLAEGVKEYRAGRPKAAALAFQRALALEPDNKLLFQFYQAAGDSLLIQMERYDELEPVLKDLLRRARIYQRELRHQPEFINLLITKLDGTSEEERIVATQELVAIGAAAIPPILTRLGDNRQDEMRTYLRVVLTRMGYRAVLPLAEALKSPDTKLVSTLATILADIGDQRALPYLSRAIAGSTDDTVKTVLSAASEAVARANGLASVPSLDDLTAAEARRYLAGGDVVRDEQVANESLVWHWDTEGSRLAFIRVPSYVWNETMAEQLLYDGLARSPDSTVFQPLLAAALAAGIVEPNLRARVAKERTTPVERPEDAADAIAERVNALADQPLRLRLMGGTVLLAGIQEAIAAQRPEAAVLLMRLLQDRALAQAERILPAPGAQAPGTVLLTALDHPNKEVRYQAAITLAHLDPARDFAGSEKVARILADAVGEWGTRVVLVVDQDYRSRNAARAALQAKGYVVATAVDGFEAVQRLEEAPMKDAILLSGNLIPSLKDGHGALIDVAEQKTETLIEKLRKDWRAEKSPIFITLPESPEVASTLEKAFEGKATGFIRKPFEAADIQRHIEDALKNADVPNANREAAEDIALRAAVALQQPDPRTSRIDVSAAADSLVTTLENRSDALRIEALKALGRAVAGPRGDAIRHHSARLTDVYGAQDGQLSPALRTAFIEAIGLLDPTTEAAVAILGRALSHEDAAVRTAAYAAVGHAVALKPALSARFLVQQRLDARSAGAGAATP